MGKRGGKDKRRQPCKLPPHVIAQHNMRGVPVEPPPHPELLTEMLEGSPQQVYNVVRAHVRGGLGFVTRSDSEWADLLDEDGNVIMAAPVGYVLDALYDRAVEAYVYTSRDSAEELFYAAEMTVQMLGKKHEFPCADLDDLLRMFADGSWFK